MPKYPINAVGVAKRSRETILATSAAEVCQPMPGIVRGRLDGPSGSACQACSTKSVKEAKATCSCRMARTFCRISSAAIGPLLEAVECAAAARNVSAMSVARCGISASDSVWARASLSGVGYFSSKLSTQFADRSLTGTASSGNTRASSPCSWLINQLHGLLARVFPELAVPVKDLSANWVLSLLEKYPTPDKLARAQPETLAKVPHLAPDMAATLRAAAAHSTASNVGPIAAELVRQKVRDLRQEQATFASLRDLVEQAWQALPDGPAGRVLTIPGIGLQTAAALVAKIVSIERLATPTALIGYFGVFPEEVDVSGTDRQGKPKQGTEIHMSRKGNDLVRRLLDTAAQCAVTWNPPVKALFARLRGDGNDYNLCLGHCMAKLLRQVFALWTKDCDFDPTFETRSKPAAEGSAATASRKPASKNGTPQASKGEAPFDQKVTMTSPTHLPPSGPRPVALPQSRPPSTRRPITVRAASEGVPHKAVPHRSQHQLAFSILHNFRSSVPRLPQMFAVSYHHPARLKTHHQKSGGITPAPLDFQRYISRFGLLLAFETTSTRCGA